MEFWRPVRNFWDYDVSDCGRVRNVKTERIIASSIDERGNVYVQLRRDGRSYTLKLRRLVAEAFLELPENFEELDVGCLDGDRTNLCADNLVWRTKSETVRHAFAIGSRVPPTMVPVRIVETGEEFASIRDCAAMLGVSPNTVSYWLDHPVRTVKGRHIERV